MSHDQDTNNHSSPVLRLRPRAPTEEIRPRQKVKTLDGPWVAHPDLVDEVFTDGTRHEFVKYAPDISMEAYRALYKSHVNERIKQRPKPDLNEMKILSVIECRPQVGMQRIQNQTDQEIANVIERQYVGAHQYLIPGILVPPSLVERFGDDWGNNARGLYYRHHYSPGWVTADHSLWVPNLDGIDWGHPSEADRRKRARCFVRHVLDNEKWNKSEYAWEADAWRDVFGLMRDDPALSVDKREYNTIRHGRYPASCLLTGESKFIKRIPDATIGLATFKPYDYQTAVADWNLDRDRLEALLVHRHVGLISDPRWGESSLVFPFAVYEAKGWSGDEREARRQACSAGSVYLDMLDNLTRQPGMFEKEHGIYQSDRHHSAQVFAFTSYGGHWHILVGYKRRRLRREYAGHQGMSDKVYVFQRIWSSRVTTERKAWELLSLIDQIHSWGVTDFRNFVIQHLQPWHDFAKQCYANDVRFMLTIPDMGHVMLDGKERFAMPTSCLQPPEWTEHVTDDTRLRCHQRTAYHLRQTFDRRAEIGAEFSNILSCIMGDSCGTLDTPGYPLVTTKEIAIHRRHFHGGGNDAEVAEFIQAWESRQTSDIPIDVQFRTIYRGSLLPRNGARKRHRMEEFDDLKFIKRPKR